MKRLLLLGGGHAHALVLRGLSGWISRNFEVKIVTPNPTHLYSGMLPGVVAGHYAIADAQIDLAKLAGRAGVDLILSSVCSFNAPEKSIHLENGKTLRYDFASLNLGSLPSTMAPGSAEHAVAAKPIERFLERWESIRRSARRIAVVGAGAAGVEMAMAIRHRLPDAEVVLYSDRPMFSGVLEARIARALERAGVVLRADMAVEAVEPGPVVVTRYAWRRCDVVLWTAGAAPLPWLRETGLATDDAGFVLVDSTLQSVSHPEVFAVGDCATLRDARHAKSGVYAVRHAGVLIRNLLETVRGKALTSYKPQPRQLALLSCGDRFAVASRGAWSAEGAWVWRWKDWLDRRWIARFR